jgi:DNA-binding transcriptional ArsR family regulator
LGARHGNLRTYATYVEVVLNPILPTFSIYVNVVWQNGRVPKTLPPVDMSEPVCCSPVAAGPLDDGAALEIALRLKALADPVRVKLVSLLFSSAIGEECSRDLAAALGLGESTVSHHLTQLRQAGLVESERRGMNVYHRARGESLVALCTVLDPNCCR